MTEDREELTERAKAYLLEEPNCEECGRPATAVSIIPFDGRNILDMRLCERHASEMNQEVPA